jgi:hypothetical protein
MKNLASIWLLLVSLFGSAQEGKVSDAWATQQFGPRFVSAQEAGFKDLKIPFSEAELRYDQTSWLIPLEIDGVIEYQLIQTLYSPNHYESYDTLSISEAKEVIRIINKTDRPFPNSEKVRFFLTKDKVTLNREITFHLILLCNGKDWSIVSLPQNTQIASVDNSICLTGENLIISAGKTNAELGKVMTLVRLIK